MYLDENQENLILQAEKRAIFTKVRTKLLTGTIYKSVATMHIGAIYHDFVW